MDEADRKIVTQNIEDAITSSNLISSQLFCCFDLNCKNVEHIHCIDQTFAALKDVLLQATADFTVLKKNKNFKIVPGWNDEVKEVHADARKKFLKWKENGKPLNGSLYDEMLSSRSLFKKTLQKCKDNEKAIRREKFSNDLNNKNYKEFWKGVNEINRNHTPYSDNIDGLNNTPSQISEMFSEKYKTILNNNKL